MEEKEQRTFKNYATEDGGSIFDQHTHRDQEGRERTLRILRLSMIGVATIILVFLVYRLTVFGARTAADFIGDLEQATPTATLDLTGLVAASPTPPATSTILAEWDTFEQELPTLDPNVTVDPNEPTPTSTRATGAIFFEPEPTETPTPTITPLPTAEFGNFNQNGDAPTLETLGWSRDPRCADQETESDYVLCVVRLAEEPINP